MTSMWPLVRKEIHPLAALWMSMMLAIWLSTSVSGPITSVAALIYVFGPAVLGAYAFGHEHAYHTLAVQLAQPVQRSTLFLVKFTVLAAMLAAIAGLRLFTLAPATTSILPLDILVLPVLGGLLVTPWLTMVCRNQMAGIVFPLAIAGTSFLVLDLIGPWLAGGLPLEGAQLAGLLWRRGLVAFALVSGVLGWRTFQRLEVIEGRGIDLHLPGWLVSRSDSREAAALWQLLQKELHLQQMTFALLVLYVPIFAIIIANNPSAQAGDRILGFTGMYALGVSLLAGSLASAEERQLGMLDIQRLMPIGAWQQWAIKALVTFGVVLVVGLLVPLVFILVNDRSALSAITVTRVLFVLGGVGGVTSVGLWVSSLMNSPTRAVATSFLLCAVLAYPFAVAAQLAVANPHVDWTLLRVSIAVLPVLLLYFAGLNHRSSDRRLARGALQLMIAGAIVWIGRSVALALYLS